MSQAPKVKIVTLGCAKNEVDSEEIAGVLREGGFVLDPTGQRADVTIINTCGFLEAAKLESIEAIKKAVRSKGNGKVIVAGCLAQRMGEELARLAPGADAYIGVGQMARFDHLVNETLTSKERIFDVTPPHHRWADVGTRIVAGATGSAYLKISEGCDHQCTFCTIPSFRGKHVSKPIDRILLEANHLVKSGVKEVNLIAQDVTQYGYDLYQEFTLPKLLKELNNVPGLDWIRLLYFYPNRLTDEVIEAMASLNQVVKYIDIPLQHTHPDVLRRMKRPWDGDRYLKLFEKLRAAMPDCAIRTTFIVGFPGETPAEFNHMVDFVQAARLDRVGAFLFSPEASTPSADYENQIPHRVKKQRYEQLMKLQQTISLQKNQQWVGKSLKVLTESARDGWTAGRSFRDAPEIDGLVYVKGEHLLGEFLECQIDSASEYDLYGSLTGSEGSVRTGRTMTSLRQAKPRAPQ